MARRAVSVDEKLAMVLAAGRPGVVIKDLCAQAGVHRDTLNEWRRRFAADGVEGLVERSRRPLRSPNQTSAELEEQIVRLRKELPLDNGADVIGWHLRRAGRTDVPSDRTIHRVLVRRGMVTPQPQKRPKVAYRRFEYDRPNQCWQIDATDWALTRSRRVTIMDVIDDHSRALIDIRVGPGPTAALAIDAILSGAAVWGLPAMVLSDNGSCFAGMDGTTSSFESVLAAAGVRVIHSRPHHPQTCGKIERFHSTLKRWLAKQPLAGSPARLQAQLDEFAHHFNHQRRSSAGGEPTPAERHAAQPPAGPSPDPLPIEDRSPKVVIGTGNVLSNGSISCGKWTMSVGTEHAGKRLTVIRYGDQGVLLDGATVIARPTLNPDQRYIPSGRPGGGKRRRPY